MGGCLDERLDQLLERGEKIRTHTISTSTHHQNEVLPYTNLETLLHFPKRRRFAFHTSFRSWIDILARTTQGHLHEIVP